MSRALARREGGPPRRAGAISPRKTVSSLEKYKMTRILVIQPDMTAANMQISDNMLGKPILLPDMEATAPDSPTARIDQHEYECHSLVVAGRTYVLYVRSA